MKNDNSNSGPEQPDPLSATGMFLRAFDQDGKKDAKPEDPFAPQPVKAAPPAAPSAPVSGRARAAAGSGSSGAGEFTQMFNSMAQRPATACRLPKSLRRRCPRKS